MKIVIFSLIFGFVAASPTMFSSAMLKEWKVKILFYLIGRFDTLTFRHGSNNTEKIMFHVAFIGTAMGRLEG